MPSSKQSFLPVNSVKPLLRPIGLFLCALLCTYAVIRQFMADGFQAHWMIQGSVFLLCLLVLRRGLHAAGPRAAVLCALWCILLSLTFIVGKAYSTEEHLLPDVSTIELWLRIAGLGLLFYALASCAVRSSGIEGSTAPLSTHQARLYFACWMGFMLLCWLPAYLYVYPGIFSTDTMVQYEEASGMAALSNYHPIVHTLLLKLGLMTGNLFGLSNRASYGLITLAQMVLFAAALSYCVLFLRTRFQSRFLAPGAGLYFALFPLNLFYSMTLWKDIPFSACVMLYCLLLYDIIASEGECLRRLAFLVRFILVQLGILLLRNNGILVLLPTLLVSLFVLRKTRVQFVLMLGGAAGIYLLMQGVLFPLLSIEQAEAVEMLSVPIQQIAGIIHKDLPLTGEEYELIEMVIPIEDIEALYDTRFPDPIKTAPRFDADALEENRAELFQVWMDLIREYPEEATLAYLHMAGGYLYPDHARPWIVYYPNVINDEYARALHNEPLVPWFSWVLNLLPNRIIDQNDALGFFFRPGYLIWAYLLACIILVCARRGRLALCLLPPLVLWLSLMIGAPLSDTRYSYPLFLIQPLMIGVCLHAKRPETTAGLHSQQ